MAASRNTRSNAQGIASVPDQIRLTPTMSSAQSAQLARRATEAAQVPLPNVQRMPFGTAQAPGGMMLLLLALWVPMIQICKMVQ